MTIKRERKKIPSDYPQITFRLPSEAERGRLTAEIEEIQDVYNSRRKDGDKVINKNDVIIEALEKGLKFMKKSLDR